MTTQFSIDDAFVLEGEEEGTVSDSEGEGWKNRDKDREGEMTFGTLSFSKPQTHQLPAASGSVEHSNLKYQASTHPQHPSMHCVHLKLMLDRALLML